MGFSVTIPNVSNADLGPLLTHLAAAGWRDPVIESLPPPAAIPDRTGLGELPASWRQLCSLEGQSYRWPSHREQYDRYVVYETTTSAEGAIQIALGNAPRAAAWGRDRQYVVAFLSGGAPQIPLVEFLEADPEESGEMLAVIRGRGGPGSRKMFGPGDSLPAPYPEAFRIESYRDRIEAPGAWNKLAVIAASGDRETMLNHALLQARRRGDV